MIHETLTFKELLQTCQAKAMDQKLNPTEESVWRGICRYYSRTFNTALTEVYQLDPMEVMLTFYESKLEEVDTEDQIEDILEAIYAIEDPEYEAEKRKELQDFIDRANEEEEERVRLGKPIHSKMGRKTATDKSLSKEEGAVELPQPKGGHIDLSYLEAEEMRSGGFDENS